MLHRQFGEFSGNLRCERGVEMTPLPSFMQTLLAEREAWRNLPLETISGEGWSGVRLSIPNPRGTEASSSLDIEDAGEEVTVIFDHAHAHLAWPAQPVEGWDTVWWDPLELVSAILEERVVASSGWIHGELRAGTLHLGSEAPDFLLRSIDHARTRSWLGTYDSDEDRHAPKA